MNTEKWQGNKEPRKRKLAVADADHRLIAWPVMLKLIDDNQMGSCRVLDYRCGTGEFCRRMRSEGLSVEGMTQSPADRRTAAKRSSSKIRFYEEDRETIEGMAGRYDVITAMMNLHYIKDLKNHIAMFYRLLRSRGIIVFSVYNPEYVEGCHQAKVVFRSLRTEGKVSVARQQGESGPVDAYVRSKEDYKKLFEKHSFEFLSSRYPPFTTEFLGQYRWELPSDNAEYLIMAMRKV